MASFGPCYLRAGLGKKAAFSRWFRNQRTRYYFFPPLLMVGKSDVPQLRGVNAGGAFL